MQRTKTNLIARCISTGLYFNGRAFEESDANKALALRPGTTADDFKLAWAAPVEIVTHGPSLAQRIDSGEIDRSKAARLYVIERHREGQKSFTIRTMDGKYISRIVHLEQSGPSRSAWIKFQGTEVALVWSNGELAV